MPIEQDGPAPYAPSARVLNVIETHRKKGLPTPITQTVIQRAGATGSLAPRVLKALKLLDLVDDDGHPTDQFEELARAPETEFNDRLAAVLRAAYADVFQFIDPATSTASEVRDQFRTYTPRGQQERMVALFLGLCEYAGIAGEDAGQDDKPKAPKKSPASKTRTATTSKTPPLPDPHLSPAGQHHFIRGLIEELPPIGSEWPREAREAWTAAALATFDLIYKASPKGKGGDSG